MNIYGLTGGIGSGKSTVAEMFRNRGVAVFDADQLGRELLSDGTDYTRQVAEHFPQCRQDSDKIDRVKLSKHVFSDGSAREWLEGLLHPAIWKEFLERTSELKVRFCLIEGAVIVESSMRFPLAGLIVVSAPTSTRAQRLQERGDLDLAQIRARIATQLPESDKLLQASHVIDNAGDLEHTRQQVDRVLASIVDELGGQA